MDQRGSGTGVVGKEREENEGQRKRFKEGRVDVSGRWPPLKKEVAVNECQQENGGMQGCGASCNTTRPVRRDADGARKRTGRRCGGGVKKKKMKNTGVRGGDKGNTRLLVRDRSIQSVLSRLASGERGRGMRSAVQCSADCSRAERDDRKAEDNSEQGQTAGQDETNRRPERRLVPLGQPPGETPAMPGGSKRDH